MLRTLALSSFIEKLRSHIPPALFGKYLLVGIGNTLFSYGSFAALTRVLTPYIPYAYMVASVVAGLLSITFSYLSYKWLIFKTKGNYLREWLRCIVVYSGTNLMGTVLLPVLVFVIRHSTRFYEGAPYFAGAIIAAMAVFVSFTGHRTFTFRTGTQA